jgi:hypothetical protein
MNGSQDFRTMNSALLKTISQEEITRHQSRKHPKDHASKSPGDRGNTLPPMATK